MAQLSNSGNQLVQQLAQKYGVSADAITHMLFAVSNGNGTMAQFNHPEFGGGGQWMQGGMTMVSDLFNYGLKNSVNNVCSELAAAFANNQSGVFSGSSQSQSSNGVNQAQASGAVGGQNGLFQFDPEANWWPQHLCNPNAVGSQNNAKYAYFSSISRLAVKTGNSVWVYDTGNHQIGGFGQQQGTGGSITFTSQFGTVNLSMLPVVWRDGMEVNQSQQNTEAASVSYSDSSFSSQPANGNDGDVFSTIEKLGRLKDNGIVSHQEFEAKKAELLARL